MATSFEKLAGNASDHHAIDHAEVARLTLDHRGAAPRMSSAGCANAGGGIRVDGKQDAPDKVKGLAGTRQVPNVG